MPKDSKPENQTALLPGKTGKKSHQEDADHPAWNVKATIAFWITCLTIEGAVLFALGAICSLEKMKKYMPHTGSNYWGLESWISYPYFIGGIAFTVGNYLCYFQVINKDNAHDVESGKVKFLGLPATWDHGATASMLNLVGALWYNVNTASIFKLIDTTTEAGKNLNTMTGIVGSVCFLLAAVLCGEYNNWRKCGCNYQVLISHGNFWGALLFLAGYAFEYNGFAHHHDKEDILVNWPFFVGSVCFLIAAWADLILWKKEIYGMAFANELSKGESEEDAPVDKVQQIMISVYLVNITLCWFRLGYVISDPSQFAVQKGAPWGIVEKILTYHCILFLCSAIHKLPKTHPYDYLVILMNFVAIIGLIGEVSMIAGIESTFQMVHVAQKPAAPSIFL